MTLSADEVEPLLARLDRLSAILELALTPQLEAAREQLRADSLDAAIFDATSADWVGSGDLQRGLTAKTGAKKRTVQQHIGRLLDTGHLQQRGAGRSTEYRSLGVV